MGGWGEGLFIQMAGFWMQEMAKTMTLGNPFFRAHFCPPFLPQPPPRVRAGGT